MVQIYCPNCNHQLWGTGRGEQGAPQRVPRKRGRAKDTNHMSLGATRPHHLSVPYKPCPGEPWGLAEP